MKDKLAKEIITEYVFADYNIKAVYPFALGIHNMKFHACKDSGNYPDKVELKMSDGKMIWYHR